MSPITKKYLFGGDRAWSHDEWVASDDRVRGGSSVSHLSPTSHGAKFHGHLDTKTLGGAGFASQRTKDASNSWDLSGYDGLEVVVNGSDKRKRYTITLHDTTLPKRPDGREQSTLSWEYDFCADGRETTFFVKWADLKPTYRGKEKKDVEPLNLEDVKRFRLMMRSFFGTQEGDFELEIASIAAVRVEKYQDEEQEDWEFVDEKYEGNQRRGMWNWLFSCCGLC